MKLNEINKLKEYMKLNSQVGLSFSGLLVFAILLLTPFSALMSVVCLFALLAITFYSISFLLKEVLKG